MTSVSSLVTTTGQTADNNVEEGDNSVDDAGENGADPVDDGHEDTAYCLANAFKLLQVSGE